MTLNTRIFGTFFSIEVYSYLNMANITFIRTYKSYSWTLSRDWKLKYSKVDYSGRSPYKEISRVFCMSDLRSPMSFLRSPKEK